MVFAHYKLLYDKLRNCGQLKELSQVIQLDGSKDKNPSFPI